MSWWRKNWKLGLFFTVFGVGLLVVLVLWLMNKHAEAEKLRAQLSLLEASTKVEGLEKDKKAREKELQANVEEAKAIDEKIADLKKEALNKVLSVDNMTDEQIAQAFKDMGY